MTAISDGTRNNHSYHASRLLRAHARGGRNRKKNRARFFFSFQ